MIVSLAWALLVSLLTGHLIMCLACPGYRPVRSHLMLKNCLAVGLGLGVSSCTFFLWLLIGGPSREGFVLSELVLFVCVIGALLYGMRGRTHAISADIVSEPQTTLINRWVPRILWISTAVALSTAVTRFFFLSLESPHGEIDAWVLWNLRARFLYRGDEQWTESLRALLFHGHSDYPLLIPATIARLWKYTGHETTIAPALVAMLFTFSTIGLAFSSLARLRTKSQGLMAALVLLGTPFLIKHGASQYADVPLAFYMLATLVLFALHDVSEKDNSGFIVGAGMMAGFAGWTKNEGLLFLAVVILSRLMVVVPFRGWTTCRSQMLLFTKGLLPVLTIILWYKTQLAPDIPHYLAQGIHALGEKLTDPARYVDSCKAFANRFLRVGHPGITLLVVYLILLRMKRREGTAPEIATPFCALVIGMTLAGYFLFHIIDPHDIQYMVDTTLDRLWIQLWPSAVFVFFLFVKTPEEAMAQESRSSGER